MCAPLAQSHARNRSGDASLSVREVVTSLHESSKVLFFSGGRSGDRGTKVILADGHGLDFTNKTAQ